MRSASDTIGNRTRDLAACSHHVLLYLNSIRNISREISKRKKEVLQQEFWKEGLHENDNGVSGSRFYISRGFFETYSVLTWQRSSVHLVRLVMGRRIN